MDNILTVPIHLKMTLAAREAAEYSNIGINKIDSMLRSPNCPFVLLVRTKKLVKRRELEEYISQKLVIWRQKIICKNSLREKNLSAIIMSLQIGSFLYATKQESKNSVCTLCAIPTPQEQSKAAYSPKCCKSCWVMPASRLQWIGMFM